jgi:hypothetical protein
MRGQVTHEESNEQDSKLKKLLTDMAAKRKDSPQQPELPIDGPKAEPVAPSNGQDHKHVQAEQVETAPSRPFVPGNIESLLHRRVDRSFLDYASYVIRDRAIPNLSDGLKPVQRRILWTLHEEDTGRFIKVAEGRRRGHAIPSRTATLPSRTPWWC